MKTETIRTITIEDFKCDPHLIDYVDENLIVLDNIDTTFPNTDSAKLDCFIIAFCMEGETNININNKSHALKADRFNFANPSFFGKFVKTHTSMTPLQYRNAKEE